MTKRLIIMALTSIAAVAVLVAVSPTSWNGADQATLQDVPEEPENPGDTFILPPAVGTDAHDEWIKWYRNAEFDGLDSYTRDIVLALHDFEVAFHPDLNHDASTEAAALLAQRDRLDGAYTPTTNERLLHDWLIEQYPTPSTIQDIDDKLLDIVHTEDNLHHVKYVYNKLNEGANIGYVPKDLRDSDWEYWHWEMHIAACDILWEDCDPVQLREDLANNRELTAEEIEAIEE
ncbi:MAG: hypothetical protein F4Y82_00415 [Cenarchaeum sp. SB0665_bin_23]|nr:hypothetical protein [Cenarchaeum sp. SB0664_bin_35]MXY60568.1 hypothetical protein [Cenarchaeum sp. SB0665_bin_23]MXZ93138.1 hypothetical protein [Cenarchaeum sp. SB0666_bin_15]MYB46245.1 hypothetical protein [Cenarchaeum sp. SB0662_bin_33]MYD59008.1 hypothetical protein [Cenarchaeum sp. SB0678_bin_8]MYG33480.1 hypothetical protein [Cenarchaeum sp. SB0677_bin_16]MYJ27169.1 hypothetical protein [Cenarchaeum sp. SB0672_bin_9]